MFNWTNQLTKKKVNQVTFILLNINLATSYWNIKVPDDELDLASKHEIYKRNVLQRLWTYTDYRLLFGFLYISNDDFFYFVGLGNLLLVLCYLCNGVLGSEKYIIRETRQGKLQGLIQKARNGAEFHAFLGVPYAKPPVDDLRWESPIPADNWEGVKDATSNPSLCMQEFVLNPKKVIGTY